MKGILGASGTTSWNTGNGGIGAMNAATAAPKSPMQMHAETVHDLASRLQELNGRLCQAIDRFAGSAPENVNADRDQPAPDGALIVAQFGAERINQSVGRLAELVSRLEGIV